MCPGSTLKAIRGEGVSRVRCSRLEEIMVVGGEQLAQRVHYIILACFCMCFQLFYN